MLDDNNLIARVVVNNDHLAFTHLVKRYQAQLRYSVLQLNGWNEILADDIVQETFISCFRSLKSFKGNSKLSTWLYTIAYNHLQQYYRKQSGNPADVEKSEPIVEDKPSNECADSQLIENTLHQKVAKIIANLSVEQRAVLHLHLHREYNQREISTMLNMPLGTIKSHISRGKKYIREHLTKL